MSIIDIVIIAFALATDAFVVSVSMGILNKKRAVLLGSLAGLFFGFFQAFMPLIGWLVGGVTVGILADLSKYVAFLLLLFLGWKFIKESLGDEEIEKKDYFDFKVLIILAIATSLDALAVGLSFSLLNIDILVPAAIIGAITFCTSFLGVYIGSVLGHFFEKRIETVAGIVLIIIAIKVLLT
jgi:putative Mn2+ efflux pump MntP